MRPAKILWNILSVLILVMVAGILFGQPAGHAAKHDPWFAEDKAMHLTAGFFVAAGTTAGTRDEWHGFAAGTAAGVLKEVYDHSNRRNGGVASWRDLAATMLGAYIGSKGTGILLTREGITFHRRF